MFSFFSKEPTGKAPSHIKYTLIYTATCNLFFSQLFGQREIVHPFSLELNTKRRWRFFSLPGRMLCCKENEPCTLTELHSNPCLVLSRYVALGDIVFPSASSFIRLQCYHHHHPVSMRNKWGNTWDGGSRNARRSAGARRSPVFCSQARRPEELQRSSPQSRPRGPLGIRGPSWRAHRPPAQLPDAGRREGTLSYATSASVTIFLKCKGNHKPAGAKQLLSNSCKTKIKQLFSRLIFGRRQKTSANAAHFQH